MHNEMLQVEGKKMSKSLGNFFTVRDLLDGNWSGGWKVPGEVIRFVYLSTHYSRPMDWTDDKAREAKRILMVWFRATDGVVASDTVDPSLVNILSNDLNTAGAIAVLHALANSGDVAGLKSAMQFLGLPDAENVGWFREEMNMVSFGNTRGYEGLLRPLLKQWQSLRNAKEYQAADELKVRIEACGLKLSVGAAGPDATATSDFDPSKLEALK
jgi:cysteinyl-tRNA synthetase